MASGVDKVLGTTELLEAILENLDMQTLLLSQRVSKTFKATINDSRRLQRALWFEPKPESEIDPNTETPNPLLEKHSEKLGICDVRPGRDIYRFEMNTIRFLKKFERIKPRSSSWQRMLVFQPTLDFKQCLICQEVFGKADGISAVIKIIKESPPEGLTLGALVEYGRNPGEGNIGDPVFVDYFHGL